MDIVFLQYFNVSIKSGAREVRNKKATPIRKKLDEGRHIPIPVKWENYMAHTENKEDLAKFISREVLINAPEDKIIVIAGDFSDPTKVEASIFRNHF